MIKAKIVPLVYGSGRLPLELYMNTNTKYLMKNDAIDVMTSGITEIKANVIVTADSDCEITLFALADGVPIKGASSTKTMKEGETSTFHINDVVMSEYIPTSGCLDITFELSAACKLEGGDVICEFVCV